MSYPKIGKTAYRPPGPIKVECTREAIEPRRVELQPGQGVLYNFKAPSRIKIELLKADDGPKAQTGPVRRPSKLTMRKVQAQVTSKED